jgi:hypothetical protein
MGITQSPSPTLLLISMERNDATSTCPADGRRVDVEVDRITLNAVAGGPRSTTTLDGDRIAMAYDQTGHL